MATSTQRTIARTIVPTWASAHDATLDAILDTAAASVGEAEYGDHYDRAVVLTAASTAPSLPEAERAAHRQRLDLITMSRPATLPWVAV